MEAIKAVAKRTTTGKYKGDLPIDKDAAEIAVMVIVEAVKKKCRKRPLLILLVK